MANQIIFRTAKILPIVSLPSTHVTVIPMKHLPFNSDHNVIVSSVSSYHFLEPHTILWLATSPVIRVKGKINT